MDSEAWDGEWVMTLRSYDAVNGDGANAVPAPNVSCKIPFLNILSYESTN